MSRPFIAAVLAAALAVTTVAASSARADQIDTQKTLQQLGTGAVLYMLGNAIGNARADDDDDDDDKKRYAHDRWQDRDDRLPRVIGPAGQTHKKRARRVLPRECLLEVRGGNTGPVMGKGCLKQNGWETDWLPARCQLKVRYPNGKVRKVFAASCLRRAGYDIGPAHERTHWPREWKDNRRWGN